MIVQDDPRAAMQTERRGRAAAWWRRLRRDAGIVLLLALAAVLTLGLHVLLQRPDTGVDRGRLAAAVGID